MTPPRPSKPAKVRRRYPLHAVFLIYCLVSLLVAVGAFNANNNLLFWLFGLSLGMLLVSGVISGSMMMSISVRREAIEQPRVGAPLRIRYSITNRSRWLPVIGLTITERLVAPPAADGHEHAGEALAAPTGSVPHVPARSTIVVEALAMPVSRGRLRLAGFDVLTTFPFGIIRKSLWHEEPVSTIIHPAETAIPEGLFASAKGTTGSGPAATRPGRLGDEPVGVREYRPGDPPKLVSWRASARRPGGDLLVRQNAEGSPRRLWVLLRLSASATPAETELALSAAASVIRGATGAGLATKGLRVGLSLRTDWAGPDGRAAGFDVAPRLGGASTILLNDLGLLVIPQSGPRTAVGGDPRLASSDIVVRITPSGQIESPSTGAVLRRLAARPVPTGGVL